MTHSPRQSRTLDGPRFALADAIARRLVGRDHADKAVLAAVTVLTGSADPDRAERLRPRPKEPAVLVERLAVWALHRADDAAVQAAGRLLTAGLSVSDVEPEAAPVGPAGRPFAVLHALA